MKRVILLLSLGLGLTTYGQTIPNAGFETWDTTAHGVVPNSWSITPGVRQSVPGHSGAYSIMCMVDTATNPRTSTLDTVVGMAYSGASLMGPPAPGSNLPGFPCSGRPDSLVGVSHFRGMGMHDTGLIIVTLSKWDTTGGARVTVAQAVFTNSVSDSVFQRFSVPLSYSSSFNPDTCVIQIMAGNPNAPKTMGTSIWADDLAFVSRTTGIEGITSGNNEVTIYPNPVTNVLRVNNAVSFVVYNLQGQVVATSAGETVNTSNWIPGMYIIKYNSKGGETGSSIISKQ